MKFKSDIEVQAGIKDYAGSSGTAGQVLSSDGATVTWIDADVGVASDVQNEVKAGVAINKGQAVYVTSADGTNIIVGLASNTSEATSSKTLGLLNATVAANGMADVVQIGRLSGLNTIGAVVGDPVWLGTNGNLIYGLANKPYAPAHLVYIGVVTRVNANNGEIFITVQNGFELDELHNVSARNPVNNDLLAYTGAPINLWETKSLGTVIGGTASQFVKGDGSLDSTVYVTLDTAQTITGEKTFSAIRTNVNGALALKSGASTRVLISSFGTNEVQFGVTPSSTTYNSKFIFPSSSVNYTFPTSSGTVALTSDLAGYVPTSRTITINGVSQDLSENRSWTVSGGVSGSGAAGQVAFWDGTTSITGESNLFWDSTNDRLGIGTNGPIAKLEVNAGALPSAANSYLPNQLAYTYNGNSEYFETGSFRTTTGSDWTTAGFRMQERIDSTWMGWMQFNGTSNNGGISFGTGTSSASRQAIGESMRITHDKNVLIGHQTDAGYKLDVNGTGRFSGQLVAGSTGSNIKLIGDTGVGNDCLISASADGNFSFTNVANTRGFVVTNTNVFQHSGNAVIGYGKNRPVTYDSDGGNFRIKANVGGWAMGYFFDGGSGTFRGGYGAYGGGDALSYYWIGDDYTTPTMIVKPAQGNVGIGTDSPNRKLEISTTSNEIPLRLKTDGSNTGIEYLGGTSNFNFFVGKQYNVSNAFEITPSTAAGGTTFSTPALVVTSGGSVLINTTSAILAAAERGVLEINGATSSIIGLKVGNAIGSYLYSTATSTELYSTADLKFAVTGAERMRIFSSGNVFIGPTPTDAGYRLDVNGTGRFSGSVTASQFNILNSNQTISIANTSDIQINASVASSNILFRVSGEERMRITSGGLVGIKTSTPTQELEVNGVIESPFLEYKPVVFYDFNSDTTGDWQKYNATLSTPSKSITRYTSTGPDSSISRSFNFSGGQNQIIRIHYKVISGTPGTGEIFYGNSQHGYSGSYYKGLELINDGNWHTLVLNMANLSSGGTDWIDYNVLDIRFDLTNNAGVVIDLDWISIGGNGYGTQYFENNVAFMNGDVGIGTTSPSGQLDVITSVYKRFTVTYPSTYLTKLLIGGNSYIQQDAAGEELRIAQEYGSGKITFFTGAPNTERMRIFANGNISMGSSAPSDNGYRLQVNGGQFGTYLKGGDLGVGSRALTAVRSDNAEAFYVRGDGPSFFNYNVTALNFFSSSDIRLKEIVDYDYGVSDIKPISYLWKDLRDNKKHVGYSAQEVQKVMPDAVNESEDGTLSINYIEVLVAKIAELENRIKQLEK